MTTNKQLFLDGNGMRASSEDAVLWAIIRGRGSAPRIALLLGWPSGLVEKSLERLSEEGVIFKGNNGSTWSLSKDHSEYEYYQKLKDNYAAIERKIVEDYPRASIEPGYLSSGVYKQLKAEGALNRRVDSGLKDWWILTDRQFECLKVARGLEKFSTKGYLTARGQTNSQYAKNELMALLKKGLIEIGEKQGKGDWWNVTKKGQDYRHEAVTKAEKEAFLSGVEYGAGEIAREITQGPTEHLLLLLKEKPMTTAEIAMSRDITRSAAHRQLARLREKGLIRRDQLSDGSNRWSIVS